MLLLEAAISLSRSEKIMKRRKKCFSGVVGSSLVCKSEDRGSIPGCVELHNYQSDNKIIDERLEDAKEIDGNLLGTLAQSIKFREGKMKGLPQDREDNVQTEEMSK